MTDERCPECGATGECIHRGARKLAVNYAPMMPRQTPASSPRAVPASVHPTPEQMWIAWARSWQAHVLWCLGQSLTPGATLSRLLEWQRRNPEPLVP